MSYRECINLWKYLYSGFSAIITQHLWDGNSLNHLKTLKTRIKPLQVDNALKVISFLPRLLGNTSRKYRMLWYRYVCFISFYTPLKSSIRFKTLECNKRILKPGCLSFPSLPILSSRRLGNFAILFSSPHISFFTIFFNTVGMLDGFAYIRKKKLHCVLFPSSNVILGRGIKQRKKNASRKLFRICKESNFI